MNQQIQHFHFLFTCVRLILSRYITSDCDAVAIIHENQTYTKSGEDSIAIVLKAG